MNAKQCKELTKDIKSLRENIYNEDKFKNRLAKEFKKNIYATDVQYIPDQFGGWNISVNIDRDQCVKNGIIDQRADQYVNGVSSSLQKSIKCVDPGCIFDRLTLLSLSNTIITGNSSLTVRI